MGINLELLESLTTSDVQCLIAFPNLLKQAELYEQRIREYYTFSIGETRKVVWVGGHNAEYLTIEGIWQARYLHQTYDVECTKEEIFRILKEEYLVQNRIKEGNGTKNDTYESVRHFRSFVNRIPNTELEK